MARVAQISEHRVRSGEQSDEIGAASPAGQKLRRPVNDPPLTPLAEWQPTELQNEIASLIADVPDTYAYRKVRHYLDCAFWAEEFRRRGE